MFKKILIILAIILLSIAALASIQPSNFNVSRSLTMNADANTIYTHINTLKNWEAWSPWARLDPEAKTTYAGPADGVGATMRWDGNMEVGAGTMTITESQPAKHIALRLDFEKPMKATNDSRFALAPGAGGTTVTWTMTGTNNFLGKLVNLFVDCETMIGDQFDKGLANMKTLVESGTDR